MKRPINFCLMGRFTFPGRYLTVLQTFSHGCDLNTIDFVNKIQAAFLSRSATQTLIMD
jgi:hypothetical protein